MFFSETEECLLGGQKTEGITLTEQYTSTRKTHRDILLENAVAVGSLQGELHAVPWSFKSWKHGFRIQSPKKQRDIRKK
jgi:hypothetical protein